ncbi:MAG: family 10 glycosylhydrolase [Prevotella sp.]|nr:family 10 glycosylhydrolase [Prevotella sp.]
MKRTLILIYVLIACIMTEAQPVATPSLNDEIRAVWLTTIGGIDWPRTYATSPATIEQQKRELTRMLDRLKLIRINTVLLQTRIRGTVIYPSSLEPWDGCISGQPGRSPGYDPLRFAIDECHKRGMELHAWVVTLPLGKWNGAGCRNMRNKYPKLIRRIGEDGFLNPEQPQTGDVIASVCEEIVRKYDVDGIHLDYIRYPDGWRIKVGRSTGREHITSIVRKIHTAVKSVRRNIKLSCSPIGKYEDLSRYSSRGWNAYMGVCQDAQGWLRMGLMDQLYPMMYFKGNQFFPFALNWSENKYGKEVAAGLGIYFLDPHEGNWKIDEVKRQLAICRQYGLGQCFFRAKFLLDNVQGLYDYLRVWNFQDLLSERLGGLPPIPIVAEAGPTAVMPLKITPNASLPFLKNDGRYMQLPSKGQTLDADVLIVRTLTGMAVATLPYRGSQASISHIQPGTYEVRSLNRKGITHRLGFLEIKR